MTIMIKVNFKNQPREKMPRFIHKKYKKIQQEKFKLLLTIDWKLWFGEKMSMKSTKNVVKIFEMKKI